MIGLGGYSCFFGLHAEQRRTKLIYTLTLAIYATTICPLLLKIGSIIGWVSPDTAATRSFALALELVGLAFAIYMSGRYSRYVFQVIFATIGGIIGLAAGLAIRWFGMVTSQMLVLLVPIALAVIGGAIGWGTAKQVRPAWKILCFSVAGGGLATTGAVGLLAAWIKSDPFGQLLDLSLSAISPLLKYLFIGIPSAGEMAATIALSVILIFTGISWQCRWLQRQAPNESTVCTLAQRSAKLLLWRSAS